MKNINEVLFKGFTLIEVLMVIVILSTMAGLGVPIYDKVVEQGGANEVYVNLQTIYRAEKLYHAKNGTYWGANLTLPFPVVDSGGLSGSISINRNLNIDLKKPKYYPFFYIRPRGGDIRRGFIAIAAQKFVIGSPGFPGVGPGGPYGKMAAIDEAGNYTPPQ